MSFSRELGGKIVRDHHIRSSVSISNGRLPVNLAVAVANPPPTDPSPCYGLFLPSLPLTVETRRPANSPYQFRIALLACVPLTDRVEEYRSFGQSSGSFFFVFSFFTLSEWKTKLAGALAPTQPLYAVLICLPYCSDCFLLLSFNFCPGY